MSNQRTDNGCYDPVDPAASDEALGSPSSDSIQPRLPSEILDLETKEIESSHPVDTFGLTGFSYPAFVLPGELFDFPSDEQKVPLEPSLADVADKTNSTVGNDLPSVLRPQHSRRLWSRCDTAMARRTYNELDDIIVRISTIMQNIESLIGEDFYGVDDHCSCTSTESSRIIYDACGELEPHDSP